MNDQSKDVPLSDSTIKRIDGICDRFEAAHKSHQKPRIEDWIGNAKGLEHARTLRELMLVDLHYRCRQGPTPTVEDYLSRFPDDIQVVVSAFKDFELEKVGAERTESVVGESPPIGLHVRCPHCHNPIEIAVDSQLDDIACGSCGSHFSLVGESSQTRDAAEVTTVGHF